jgi:phosphoglycerate dehydrogenase-like enzyme
VLPPIVFFDRVVPDDVLDLLDDRLQTVGPDDAHLAAAEAVVSGTRRWDGPTMDLAPNLRVISRTGVGYDNVDVDAATARGIVVCHAADAPTVSTAEHAIALLLGITKLLPAWGDPQGSGWGRRLPSGRLGAELDGRTLGLVGCGRIGRRVAAIARAMGMHTVACDPFLTGPDVLPDGTELVVLDELWSRSDVVSLHAPATTATRHLVDAAALSAMPSGSYLVNCARGSLVDHDALLAALDDGRLAAAGLDVTEPEPLPEGHPLLTHPRVLLTPHVASHTMTGRRRLYDHAIANALAALAGDLSSVVPEQRAAQVRPS